MKNIGCKIITMPPRAQKAVDISVAFLLTASLLLNYILCPEHDGLKLMSFYLEHPSTGIFKYTSSS